MKTTEQRQKNFKGQFILPKEFVSKGITFQQIVREDNYAIYAISRPRWRSKSYEVIEIQTHNGYELAGVAIPPAECYPGSSQWGVLGFSYQNKDDALKKFNQLVELEKFKKKVLQKASKKSKK